MEATHNRVNLFSNLSPSLIILTLCHRSRSTFLPTPTDSVLAGLAHGEFSYNGERFPSFRRCCDDLPVLWCYDTTSGISFRRRRVDLQIRSPWVITAACNRFCRRAQVALVANVQQQRRLGSVVVRTFSVVAFLRRVSAARRVLVLYCRKHLDRRLEIFTCPVYCGSLGCLLLHHPEKTRNEERRIAPVLMARQAVPRLALALVAVALFLLIAPLLLRGWTPS